MIYRELSTGARDTTRYKFITTNNIAAEACISKGKPLNLCCQAQYLFVFILTYISVLLSFLFFLQEQQKEKATQFFLYLVKYRKAWTEIASNSPLVSGQELILNGKRWCCYFR